MSSSELFDIFDAAQRHLGTAPRYVVHRDGLWHRAVNVFLFSTDGHVWLQRRASSKDVCPHHWDLSVAEHLTPGETFAQAAVRGLREELGVVGVALEPLGEVYQHCIDIPAQGLHNHEFQQNYVGQYDGPFTLAPNEVTEVRAVALSQLMAEAPGPRTPWLEAAWQRDGVALQKWRS